MHITQVVEVVCVLMVFDHFYQQFDL